MPMSSGIQKFKLKHVIKGNFTKRVKDFGKFVNHGMQVPGYTVDGIEKE